MPTPKPTWTSVKPAVAALDRNALIGLVKDLFDASKENRALRVARFTGDEDQEAAVEEYRRKIVEQFYPNREIGNTKLGHCRKQISDYRKARGDTAGLAELMLVFVESGVSYSKGYGFYDDDFLSSLISMTGTLVTLF